MTNEEHFKRVFKTARKVVKKYLNPNDERDFLKTKEMKEFVEAVTDHPEWGKR